MIIFLQGIIIEIALFVVLISIKERKVPKGLLEWLFIIVAFTIMVIWIIKY